MKMYAFLSEYRMNEKVLLRIICSYNPIVTTKLISCRDLYTWILNVQVAHGHVMCTHKYTLNISKANAVVVGR